MNRRELLLQLGLTAAIPLSSRVALSYSSQRAGSAGEAFPRSPSHFDFSESARRFVGAVADAMIPETDTPGAMSAGVVDFVGFMLGNWFSAEECGQFMDGMAALDALSREKYGVDFASCGKNDQTILLTVLEREALEANSGLLDPKAFIARIKLLILTGYYTSEVGASVELDNRMIFPSFEGCIELTPDDRQQSMASAVPTLT
jgi:Gluconate 2-dehydrogenase subunit 3